MPLTTLANVRAIPGPLRNPIATPTAWVEQLIAAADECIKQRTKRRLELQCFTEFYDGNDRPDLFLFQYPVWSGTTQVAAGSDGVTLPTATINVATTLNPDGSSAFDPGGRTGQQPVIAVQTSLNTWTTVSYTGTTATSFTGCSGGTGTLSSAVQHNAVSQPVVHFDPAAYDGQAPPSVAPYSSGVGPFADGTIQVQGVNYYVVLDTEGNKSHRGILRSIGGFTTAGFGIWNTSWNYGQRSKLAARTLPVWPRGYGCTKVQYSAGYETVPADLTYAATTLVAGMVRNQSKGAVLASENLGAYSYSVLQNTADNPEMASVQQILGRYTEVAW